MSTEKLSADNQTIVVTGASGDIGLAIVERLISDGFHVAACCRSKADRIRAAFADLSQITIYELDLRDADSIKSCASHHQRERTYRRSHQQREFAQGSLASMTRVSDMRDVFEVNLFGPLQFAIYHQEDDAPEIRCHRQYHLDSRHPWRFGTLAYGGSKAALARTSRVMATEFGPLGIRVNAVTPSAVASVWPTRWTMPPARRDRPRGTSRRNDTADVAILCPICCPTGRRPFGQIIRIDRAMPF